MIRLFKNKLFIIFVSLFFLVSCANQETRYENFKCSKEYIEDFKLNDNLTYYSLIQENKENILFFWASWCPHCKNVMSFIQQEENYEILDKYIFTVSLDDNIENVEIYTEFYSVYLDYDLKVFDSTNCEHIPSILIVDSNGKILACAIGESESIELLNEFLSYHK